MYEAAQHDPAYYDVCAMAADSSFVAHDDFVESMMVRNGLLYTAGERKCKLWDPNTGQSWAPRF
jgi:hypothetical protein